MNHLTRWQLRLTIEAPFLTQSSSAASYGLDAAAARTNEGMSMVPGSLIVGNLSHAWKAWCDLGVAKAADLLEMLGSSSGDDKGDYDPRRKQLIIDDLAAAQAEEDEAVPITRTRRDEATQSAKKGALKIVEQPWLPRNQIIYEGSVRSFAPPAELENIKNAILAGLIWPGQLGAGKGVGFGLVTKVTLDELKQPKRVTNCDQNLTSVSLALRPDRGFCFAEHSHAGNLFEGTEFMPGAGVKGALASTWAALLGKMPGSEICQKFDPDRPALSKHFENLIVLHAFPGKDRKRAVALPQSLVKYKDGPKTRYSDVAKRDSEFYVINGKAAAFQPDWKDRDYAEMREYFGWPRLQKDLRIRTRIEYPSTNAKEGFLFAYESVDAPSKHAVSWFTEIRLDSDKVPKGEQSQVIKELLGLIDSLGGELGYLGKTKAFATVGVSESWFPALASDSKPTEDEEWIITLQTPALIGDWSELDEASTEKNLFDMYEQAFDELSGGSLKLIRYFARQRLAGGRYLHHRFREKGATYRPWLLTEAGSVFVVRRVGECVTEAAAQIDKWMRTNLPVPDWLEKEAANRPLWKAIPFLPEGGYGEINVNLACHRKFPLELRREEVEAFA